MRKVKEMLLMRSEPEWPSTQLSLMSTLKGFFKESDTQLGVFYPKHYLIAVFRHLPTAQQAVAKLRLAGFAEDEAIAVAGEDVLELTKEESGPGNFLMQAVSRFFATEQVSHDSDLRSGRAGGCLCGGALPASQDQGRGLESARSRGSSGSPVLRQ